MTKNDGTRKNRSVGGADGRASWGAACCAPTCFLETVRAKLGAGFVDHFFPDAAGFEKDFDDLAGGAFAAVG